MNRRTAKKQHRRDMAKIREVVGEAVPCPPKREGVLLVPDDYVGWVLITTPSDRRKVRYVDEHGRVWRDDQGLRGHGHSIRYHAIFCRVEPCAIALSRPGLIPRVTTLATRDALTALTTEVSPA